MTPTIVLDGSGKLYAVVGSPGGSLIINYVAKTLVGILDWKLDPQVAADLPNRAAATARRSWKREPKPRRGRRVSGEGHEVKLIEQNSGIHAIVVTPAGLVGGADSRREGVAIGN